MAWEIHQEYLKKRYIARSGSCGCALYCVSVAVLVVVPFLLAFASQSFWTKQKWYFDQPEVAFQHRLVLHVEGEGTVSPFAWAWTTSPALNDLLGSNLVVPSIKSRAEDTNGDGYSDAFTFTVSFSTASAEQQQAVRRVRLVAFFDYKLHGDAKLSMDALAIVDASSAMPASALTVSGDLVFRQRQALHVGSGYAKPYTASPIWDESKGYAAIDFADLVAQYSQRNFTTEVHAPYPMWKSNLAYGSTTYGVQDTTFTATVTLKVPPTVVLATPSTSEMLKFAWMQYLAMLVVVWVLVRYARIFIFGQKLVASSTVTDGARKLHTF